MTRTEQTICTACRYDLPYAKFHSVEDNPVTKTFWGRLNLKQGYTLLEYSKESIVQDLLHELKYSSNKYVGIELGKLMGQEMKDLNLSYDVLVPVPLHPRKKKERGYNQAEIICEGIQQICDTPIETDVLIRKQYTKTQTAKGRSDRWDNVEQVFGIKSPEKVLAMNVLLVDDVITTGATLEACGSHLQKTSIQSLSVASIACVL